MSFRLPLNPRKVPVAKGTVKEMSRRTVSGTITGPDGKPVAGAVVRWDLLVSSDSVPETQSDPNGAFRLEAVPDEANVLTVMAKGLAPAFPLIDAGGDHQVNNGLDDSAGNDREHVLDLEKLAFHSTTPRSTFDRLLVAQARVEGANSCWSMDRVTHPISRTEIFLVEAL